MNNSSELDDIENNYIIETNNILHLEIDDIDKDDCYHYSLINNNYYNNCNTFFNENFIKILEKFISISLHIFIMIVFEIYFYFNYVIIIEKNLFIQKINKYLENFNDLNLNENEKIIINNLISNNDNKLIDTLYNNYLDSKEQNNIIINKLIYKSSFYASIVGFCFLIFLLIGIFYRKNIKWKWVIWENIMMLLFLGLFEYYFFFNIVLKYNPINDDELKYLIVKGFLDYINT